MLRQNRDKNYADSEKDGFMHQTSNTTLESKKEIAKKYSKEIEQEEIKLQDVLAFPLLKAQDLLYLRVMILKLHKI